MPANLVGAAAQVVLLLGAKCGWLRESERRAAGAARAGSLAAPGCLAAQIGQAVFGDDDLHVVLGVVDVTDHRDDAGDRSAFGRGRGDEQRYAGVAGEITGSAGAVWMLECIRCARAGHAPLAPLEAVAKQDLVARGLTVAGKIPIVHATVALFPSKNLVQAQKAYRLINDLKIVLPIVTLVLLGMGVVILAAKITGYVKAPSRPLN
jgi:hypothetical protein